jgi:hypothetical protein
MTTELPTDLNLAAMLAFLFNQYGPEPFKVFLREVNELNRYGAVFSLEKQQSTIKELRTMGLDTVALVPMNGNYLTRTLTAYGMMTGNVW